MDNKITYPDFSALLTYKVAQQLQSQLYKLSNQKVKKLIHLMSNNRSNCSPKHLCLNNLNIDDLNIDKSNFNDLNSQELEWEATNWLIEVFEILFAEQRVQLIRGQQEPEYFPASHNAPARIEFAHGFFASALHETSHWCIAGEHRRQLNDFGYWYATDGRNQVQQRAFERVEIRPQALECLFTLACGRPFEVSQDNLFADFDTHNSSFANDVYEQVKEYLAEPKTLPRDAQTLLQALLTIRACPQSE